MTSTEAISVSCEQKRNERDIPQSWIFSYMHECLSASKKHDPGSVGEQLALQRAQYALDLLTVWRASA